jgi:hypothetical protein
MPPERRWEFGAMALWLVRDVAEKLRLRSVPSLAKVQEYQESACAAAGVSVAMTLKTIHVSTLRFAAI